jgi:hypothetical protein
MPHAKSFAVGLLWVNLSAGPVTLSCPLTFNWISTTAGPADAGLSKVHVVAVQLPGTY